MLKTVKYSFKQFEMFAEMFGAKWLHSKIRNRFPLTHITRSFVLKV